MSSSLSNPQLRPPDGIVRGYRGDNLAVRLLIIIFLSIALYNAIELGILLFMAFAHYRGRYFWSLFLSIFFGVIPYSVGYILELFALAPLWLCLTITTIGFYVMVPGQSVILYVRLHLIIQKQRTLRFVFWLIVIDTIILLIPTTVLTFGTAYAQTTPFIQGYSVMERLQLAWFCAQEFAISGIYIAETIKLLNLMPQRDRRRTKIMYELLAINFVIILLDIALLVVEYIGYYALQNTLKSAVYSIKLKLEFGVLGKLVSLVQINTSQLTSGEQNEQSTFG